MNETENMKMKNEYENKISIGQIKLDEEQLKY